MWWITIRVHWVEQKKNDLSFSGQIIYETNMIKRDLCGRGVIESTISRQQTDVYEHVIAPEIEIWVKKLKGILVI